MDNIFYAQMVADDFGIVVSMKAGGRYNQTITFSTTAERLGLPNSKILMDKANEYNAIYRDGCIFAPFFPTMKDADDYIQFLWGLYLAAYIIGKGIIE